MLDFITTAHFNVMIGQGMPRPASAAVMDQFVSAEVAVSDSDRSGFELVFEAVRASALAGSFPILEEPGLKAGARVVLTATLGLRPTVLMDGIVTDAAFEPAGGDAPAKLTITGMDLTFVMDREEREVSHPAQGPGDIARFTLLRYAQFGVIPTVIDPPAAERPSPTQRVPMQRGSDYAYLKALAAQFDSIFTLIPGPAPLTSRAYWGPLPRIGAPQPAITVDMGPETNATNLSFENAEAEAAQVTGQVQDPQSGQTVPVRSTVPFRPPLAARPATANPSTVRTNLFDTNGAPSTAQALSEAQAQSDATLDTVKVSGELSTASYGGILAPRGLVGLRGAGLENDGLFYVKSVVQKITRGGWSQLFELTREGTGSTVPVVRP